MVVHLAGAGFANEGRCAHPVQAGHAGVELGAEAVREKPGTRPNDGAKRFRRYATSDFWSMDDLNRAVREFSLHSGVIRSAPDRSLAILGR
jgi:hypothetical protein